MGERGRRGARGEHSGAGPGRGRPSPAPSSLNPRGQVPWVSGGPPWRSLPSGGGAGAFPAPPAALTARTCGSFVLPTAPTPQCSVYSHSPKPALGKL